MKKTFVDFFAGIGLVEFGLSYTGWEHLLSVDYSELKRKVYEANFGKSHSVSFKCSDIFELEGCDIPEVFLAHASFPCTDVSSAGPRTGVQDGNESSAIDSFLRIVSEMGDRKPAVLMLENVKGLINSHNGKDLRFLVRHINSLGYVVDLLSIDAKHFVPQSRERVFLICQNTEYEEVERTSNAKLKTLTACDSRSKSVVRFIKENSDLNWVTRDLPPLPEPKLQLSDIIDTENDSWWSSERTDYLLTQMFDRHLFWLQENVEMEEFRYATAFRRMRVRDGKKQSTAEIRYDGVAGCLRTAKGGSARQILVRTGKGEIKARLLSTSECSKLMGAQQFSFDGFSINDALHCLGDAVCVDVVKWLDRIYLTPLFESLKNAPKESIAKKCEDAKVISSLYENRRENFWDGWCKAHQQSSLELRSKANLHGSLIVLSSVINGHWSYEDLYETESIEKGDLFSDSSIRGLTPHRLKKVLSEEGYSHLAYSHDEQESARAFTKKADFDMIRGLVALVQDIQEPHRSEQLVWHARQLLSHCIMLLQSFHERRASEAIVENHLS